MKFAVIIPTYNRAHTLERAITSVLQQTWRDFKLTILDDGSTDATPAVVAPFLNDPRVEYRKFVRNEGATAMDTYGLIEAVESADVWTRLGSDDWFGPAKLANDVVALEQANADVVYGPFAACRDGKTLWVDTQLKPPRKSLLYDRFFVGSWANIAVRTRLLNRVFARYGNYIPPTLRHVDDVVFNARLIRFTDFVWRPGVDGFWSFGGATETAAPAVRHEQVLSWQIVAQENATFLQTKLPAR